MDSTRRPNQCPRCGFAYSSLYPPRARRRNGEIRVVGTPLALPWQCRCGAWLRAKAWSFNWLDIAALVFLSTIQLFVAVRFWWARNFLVFFVPIGAWFAYRMSKQFAVEEVAAPEESRREVA